MFFHVILNGEQYFNKSFGYYLDIPEGWSVKDDTNDAMVSFSDESGGVLLQVYVFKADVFSTVDDIRNYIKASFKAEGDEDRFKYQGDDSIISDLTFSNGRLNLRGYFIFIKSREYNYVICAYSTVETYKIYHEFLLSSIDSFSIDKKALLYAGPINQYYYISANKKIDTDILIDNKKIKFSTDEKEIESTEVLIDRESKVLANYSNKENRYKAWSRYYKMIYRDNYQRIARFTDLLKKELKIDSFKKEDVCKMLVSWVQEFKFSRDKESNDLLSPLEALFTLSGDCDSKALLLCIIFNQLNIDAVMVVSEVYSHAGIILNINASGASFNYKGKPYYYAELNAKVEIGRINQKMADESNWMAINFTN